MEYSQLLVEDQLLKIFDQSFEENYMDSSKNIHKVVPVIQNIVSSVNLECKLNLSTIARQSKNTQYDPKLLDAVLMSIRNPKTTALFFASGKMLCTEQKPNKSQETSARSIQKLAFPVKFVDFKIQNIVASCGVNFGVRLESLMIEHAKCSLYEPEIFPGLIYKIKKLNLAVMISASGKIVIAGTRVKDDIFKAFEIIYPILQQYKKA